MIAHLGWICENQAEIELCKGNLNNQGAIFNQWDRIAIRYIPTGYNPNNYSAYKYNWISTANDATNGKPGNNFEIGNVKGLFDPNLKLNELDINPLILDYMVRIL